MDTDDRGQHLNLCRMAGTGVNTQAHYASEKVWQRNGVGDSSRLML